jgi:signal transduction histidine kinase
MNPISAFFVRNIVIVFFFYGLAFFAMGLALALASQRTSEFRFAQAIRPLAAFGVLHGIHEWIEMFQKIATLTGGYTPAVPEEVVRLAILIASFAMLLAFGILLLSPPDAGRRRLALPLVAMIALWALSVWVVARAFNSPPEQVIALGDALARYSLGIPGALLGTWALMTQQRTFHRHGMPQFGRDLVWCATALFLYGAIGQIFVRQTPLLPSMLINSTLFLQWFGIPVQLFRTVMAGILAVYMVRALNAFELESQQRLEDANHARLQAQAAALEAERRISREMERLNEELRLAAHELALLLDLSNSLAAPMGLQARLYSALEEIVGSLHFPDEALIVLARPETRTLQVQASIGFSPEDGDDAQGSHYLVALDLGEQCVTRALATCWHEDDTRIEFVPEEALTKSECQERLSDVVMLSLPLNVRHRVIGSLVMGKALANASKKLSLSEFKLMLGIAQQVGLSIENARLYQQAQEREGRLAELLHQVVGAQEAERQRIARELHDATGQTLTAIALGLRGVESMLENGSQVAISQVKELKSFSTNALGELRQIISDLRPSQLDDLGLTAALQWYVQEFEKRHGIRSELILDGTRSRLSPEYETVLFRITQEALNNVVRHAGASCASVKLEVSSAQACVTIEDNGHGFDVEKTLRNQQQTGWGLLGIQERALLLGGRSEIDSKPGRGTRVRVSVPLTREVGDVEDKTVTG